MTAVAQKKVELQPVERLIYIVRNQKVMLDKRSREIHWIKNPPLPRKHPIGFVVHKEPKK